MDKKGIFIQIGEFEEKVKGLHDEFQKFKEQLVPLIEENHWLHIENKKLRERLEAELEASESGKEKRQITKPLVGEGYDNLARLYQEGFHICNTHYGSLRSDGEDCLFCLSFLQQK